MPDELPSGGRTPRRARLLGKPDYEALAAFRLLLRRFLSFSEDAANAIGLAPQQYQALLAVKGFPGREVVSIKELAEQLLIRHNSAVELVDRLESEGLVSRRAAARDRRQVDIELTARGTRVFERLAAAHHAELGRIGPELAAALERLPTRRIRAKAARRAP